VSFTIPLRKKYSVKLVPGVNRVTSITTSSFSLRTLTPDTYDCIVVKMLRDDALKYFALDSVDLKRESYDESSCLSLKASVDFSYDDALGLTRTDPVVPCDEDA
jgi:hypothetical protein